VHVKARLIQPRLSILFFSAPDMGLTAVSSHNRAPLVYPSAHQADPTVRTSELMSCDKAQFCTDHGYKYFAFQGRCNDNYTFLDNFLSTSTSQLPRRRIDCEPES
jgi:hypothetical protein